MNTLLSNKKFLLYFVKATYRHINKKIILESNKHFLPLTPQDYRLPSQFKLLKCNTKNLKC